MSKRTVSRLIQGYLGDKKTPTPLGPHHTLRHRATVGTKEEAVSDERGKPVDFLDHSSLGLRVILKEEDNVR